MNESKPSAPIRRSDVVLFGVLLILVVVISAKTAIHHRERLTRHPLPVRQGALRERTLAMHSDSPRQLRSQDQRNLKITQPTRQDSSHANRTKEPLQATNRNLDSTIVVHEAPHVAKISSDVNPSITAVPSNLLQEIRTYPGEKLPLSFLLPYPLPLASAPDVLPASTSAQTAELISTPVDFSNLLVHTPKIFRLLPEISEPAFVLRRDDTPTGRPHKITRLTMANDLSVDPADLDMFEVQSMKATPHPQPSLPSSTKRAIYPQNPLGDKRAIVSRVPLSAPEFLSTDPADLWLLPGGILRQRTKWTTQISVPSFGMRVVQSPTRTNLGITRVPVDLGSYLLADGTDLNAQVIRAGQVELAPLTSVPAPGSREIARVNSNQPSRWTSVAPHATSVPDDTATDVSPYLVLQPLPRLIAPSKIAVPVESRPTSTLRVLDKSNKSQPVATRDPVSIVSSIQTASIDLMPRASKSISANLIPQFSMPNTTTRMVDPRMTASIDSSSGFWKSASPSMPNIRSNRWIDLRATSAPPSAAVRTFASHQKPSLIARANAAANMPIGMVTRSSSVVHTPATTVELGKALIRQAQSPSESLGILSKVLIGGLMLGLPQYGTPFPLSDLSRRSRLISISLKDADIGEVMRLLSEKSGINIVTDSNIAGRKVTVRLQDVEPEEAIELIVAANGLAFQRRGNAYLITTPDRVTAESALVSEAIVLKNTDPLTMRDIVEKVLGPTGTVRVVEKANAIVVTDSAANITLIKQLVTSLEESSKARAISTEVITLKRVKAGEVEQAIHGLLSPRGGVKVIEGANSLIVTDEADKIAAIRTIAAGMDAPEPKSVEVFQLRNATADQMLEVLKTLIADPKDVQANKETNTITLRATPAEMERLRKVIEQLDVGLARQERTAQAIVLKYADPNSVREVLLKFGLVTENTIQIYSGEMPSPGYTGARTISGSAVGGQGLGGGTGGGGGGGGIAGGGGGGIGLGGGGIGLGGGAAGGGGVQGVLPFPSNTSSTPRNFLVILDTPDNIARIVAMVETLDKRPRMVVIEAKVLEINTVDLKNLGISSIRGPSGAGNFQTGKGTGNFDIDAGTGTLGVDTTLVPRTRIGVTVNALIQNRRARLLANPKIATAEGQQAIVFVGDQVPIIEAFSLNLAQATSTVRFVPVGITLNLKPRVDDTGYITMEVDAVVSIVTAFIESGGTRAPQIGTREASTLVRVKQGDALILGGLLREDESNLINKVPLLGDLPILGGFFRNRTKSKMRTEVVIVLTPRVLKEEEQISSLESDVAIGDADATNKVSATTVCENNLRTIANVAMDFQANNPKHKLPSPTELDARLLEKVKFTLADFQGPVGESYTYSVKGRGRSYIIRCNHNPSHGTFDAATGTIRSSTEDSSKK